MKTLRIFIRSFWMLALLAIGSDSLATGASGIADLRYDSPGDAPPRVAYDRASLSASDYDLSPTLPACEKDNAIERTRAAFPKFSGFLAAEGTEVAGSRFWTTSEFNGTRVYQRNDLIDTALVDARGRSNPSHYEIVPIEAGTLTPDAFIELLLQIQTK